MHPPTKYNCPIWKDKKVMVRTSFSYKTCVVVSKEGVSMLYMDFNYVSPSNEGRHCFSLIFSASTSSASSQRRYHVRFQFAKWFQKRRLKSKTLQTTDAK
jgi:hypothetical protein